MYYINMNVILTNFSKNLKLMLQEKGLKQNKFAEMVGVNTTSVSKWILSQREPTLTNIYKITKILDCTFEDLTGN